MSSQAEVVGKSTSEEGGYFPAPEANMLHRQELNYCSSVVWWNVWWNVCWNVAGIQGSGIEVFAPTLTPTFLFHNSHTGRIPISKYFDIGLK